MIWYLLHFSNCLFEDGCSLFLFCWTNEAYLSPLKKIKVYSYHAGLNGEQINDIPSEFMKDNANIMAATNTFGMAIQINYT